MIQTVTGRRRTRIAVCAVVLAAILGLAGCGGGPDGTAPSGQVTIEVPGGSQTPVSQASPTATGSTDSSAHGGDVGGSAGMGGRQPSDSDVYGIPNPGWSDDDPNPPVSGPGADALRTAENTVDNFFERFFSYGTGDSAPTDSYQAVMAYVDPDLAARFAQEMSDMADGTTSTAEWDRLVASGQRYTVMVTDKEWADWSHPDSCVLAVQFKAAYRDWPDGDWPPYVQTQWKYVTMLRSSGWKVHSWSSTAPLGWRLPTDQS